MNAGILGPVNFITGVTFGGWLNLSAGAFLLVLGFYNLRTGRIDSTKDDPFVGIPAKIKNDMKRKGFPMP